MRAFTEYRDKLLCGVDIPSLFPQKPLLEFHPENTTCCHSHLHVQKTRTRQKVTTMDIGTFAIKETVLQCGQCQRTYPSQELKKLIPPGCNYGYDVLVHVGKSLFLQYKNEKEIQGELKERRNIAISCSEIAYLAKKFVVYLAVAHQKSSARIKQALDKKGGYILHVDAMGEGGSPRLMSALDEISRIVLGNVKIPTEKVSEIIPFFQRIKKSFGKPIAVVRDMGKGISGAVSEVFRNIPDFICHFHFLRDIGKDLFDKENDLIRKRLRVHGICGRLRKMAARLKKKIDTQPDVVGSLTAGLENGAIEEEALEYAPIITVYTLIQWALEGKNQGHGYGFPFDRPYLVFYQRLQTIYLQGKRLQKMRLRESSKDNRPFRQLCRLLEDTLGDETLKEALRQMQEKIGVFDKLREAMRIAEPRQSRGLNDDGEDTDIKTIKRRVEEFRRWLVHKDYFKQNRGYRKMVEQIDRYWEKLFADPIVVNTPRGKITIQPQRTSNLLERFFRTIRYGYRKKSGNNFMSKTIKAMLAETPLVKNLNNPDYLQIILNGKATLEELFAEIDSKTVRAEMKKARQYSEKVPPEIKALINKPQLPEILLELFANQLKT